MAIKTYIKKPIPIKAIQWNGENTVELLKFSRDIRFVYHDAGEGPIKADIFIKTLEGDMHANVGDYIIKGIRGEVYPCAREIFEETYEEQ